MCHKEAKLNGVVIIATSHTETCLPLENAEYQDHLNYGKEYVLSSCSLTNMLICSKDIEDVEEQVDDVEVERGRDCMVKKSLER